VPQSRNRIERSGTGGRNVTRADRESNRLAVGDSAYNQIMAVIELDQRGLIVPCAACGQKNRLAFERLGQAVRCAKCKHDIGAPDTPIEMQTSADFDRLVAQSSLPVVVDYWAPWCGPCRMVAPELQKVAARQTGRVIVVKVNTEELTDLGQRFGIRSIPTLAVFSGGREVGRSSGARPAAEIEAFIEQTAGTLHS
jgi:thioredoxin 2